MLKYKTYHHNHFMQILGLFGVFKMWSHCVSLTGLELVL